MPNSPCEHDHNHGPIEVAIKETARGRAFLAEYASRVRQSDTLTMLAMIGRLERVCQDLAVRLAEPDRRPLTSGGQAIESPSGRALKSDIDQTVSLASEFACVDQTLEALDRIAHLVDMLRDLDRRVGDVSSATAYSQTGRLADIATIESDGETSIVRSAEFDASERPWPDAPESQKHHPEEEVLDDIAKALETTA
jgi:hypothetical protein